MPRPERFKVAHVAAALQKASGIPSVAAEILGKAYGSCTAVTVRNYLKRYPRLAEIVEETTETTLDLAEAKLLNAIANGTDWAVRFYLETKGKRRGYSRRTELTGPGGKPIEVANARGWLAEELEQMESRLRGEPGGTDGPAAPGGPDETVETTVH